MNDSVKAAVSNLLVEPCSAFQKKAVEAVDASSDADRRMAIGMIEDHLRVRPEAPPSLLAETLIQLRRVAR